MSFSRRDFINIFLRQLPAATSTSPRASEPSVSNMSESTPLPVIDGYGKRYVPTSLVVEVGKCGSCGEPIRGEDARYYEEEDKKAPSVRKHFILAH